MRTAASSPTAIHTSSRSISAPTERPRSLDARRAWRLRATSRRRRATELTSSRARAQCRRCDDVAAGALPFACHTRRVAVAGDAGTGTCEEKAPVGAPCVTPPEGTLPCEDDAICDAISGKCVARGHAGDACSTDTRCRPMLYCNNASDPTKPGVCVARGNAGDACSYTSPCDHVQLLTCQGACAASDLSATQCGATYELPCASNGYCFLYSGGGGMCYAAAGDGEVCGYGTCDQRTPGDQPCITCLPPARCLGGRCKITGIDCR